MSLDEKLEIFERFFKTGEELLGNTVYEGYPLGHWAVQIRSQVNCMKEGKRGRPKVSQEQFERLRKLGILERKIDSNIDEKIQSLVDWMKKYPKLEVRGNINPELIRKYARTEEEYKEIEDQWEKMKKYYNYVNRRKSQGKLTEEQILKCKEGNVKGAFGYPTTIEELSRKTGKPIKIIDYIITNYGTMDNFIKLYLDGSLEGEDLKLAQKTIRRVIDIDNPISSQYDMLASDIFAGRTGLQLYSGEAIKRALEALKENEANSIKRKYGIDEENLPRTLSSIGDNIGVSRSRVAQIITRALRKLRDPRRKKEIGRNFEPIDMFTDEEKKLLVNLPERICSSDLIYFNYKEGISPKSKQIEDILKALELIKNRDVAQLSGKTCNTTEDKEIQSPRENKLEIPIAELGLSVRAYNALSRANIKTLGDIAKKSTAEISAIRNAGRKTCKEIEDKLAEYGLAFRKNEKIQEQIENILEIPIAELGLSVRAYNALKRANIKTLGDIAKKSTAEISAIRNAGRKTCEEIEAKLAEYGLSLRSDAKAEEANPIISVAEIAKAGLQANTAQCDAAADQLSRDTASIQNRDEKS